MTDTYTTIRQLARAEIKVNGSRFIAEARPVASEDEAEEAIGAVRRREHKATHHCTTYRLGPKGDVFRYNDDGEPSGTAGLPILRQLEGRELTNALVVVTRYFGGAKLGTGGLARAYGEAAAEAIDAAGTVERVLRALLRLRFGYNDTSPAMRTIEQFGAQVQKRNYTEETELVVAVRCSEAEAFVEHFTNALAGRGQAERLQEDRSANDRD